jgi:hypothetical protein
MLAAILISLLAGAVIGVLGFILGHAWASKMYSEIISGLHKAKSAVEEELARLKQRL